MSSSIRPIDRVTSSPYFSNIPEAVKAALIQALKSRSSTVRANAEAMFMDYQAMLCDNAFRQFGFATKARLRRDALSFDDAVREDAIQNYLDLKAIGYVGRPVTLAYIGGKTKATPAPAPAPVAILTEQTPSAPATTAIALGPVGSTGRKTSPAKARRRRSSHATTTTHAKAS